MIRPIIQLGDGRLRQKCLPVNPIGPDTKKLFADLADTLRHFQAEHGTGRGIAAPQIGIPLRAVHIEYGRTHLSLCNPVIVNAGSTMMDVWDSCFSYWGVVFRVRRHYSVVVSYDDLDGHKRELQAEGELSELLQHEIEHLDGVLAIDQLVPAGSIITWDEFCRTGQNTGDRRND